MNIPSCCCDDPIAATRRWLERAVIGLNLCPFAKAVYVKQQVRFVLSAATTPEALLEDLAYELVLLDRTAPEQTDTTLLVHPHVLGDFLDYNDFLDQADAAVDALGLEGEIQVASSSRLPVRRHRFRRRRQLQQPLAVPDLAPRRGQRRARGRGIPDPDDRGAQPDTLEKLGRRRSAAAEP
jgi:hypothetical protein